MVLSCITGRASSGKDRTGRQNVVRPRFSFLLVRHVDKMGGRTAPLRTLLLPRADSWTQWVSYSKIPTDDGRALQIIVQLSRCPPECHLC